MNDKHTPEPWVIKCHTCASPEDIDGGDDYTIVGADGTKIAFEPCEYDSRFGADARRIVACVNACAGTSTKALEEITKHGTISPAEAVIEIAKQRDELLAALENCRLLAARHRMEEWAGHVLRFCGEAGVAGEVMRGLAIEEVRSVLRNETSSLDYNAAGVAMEDLQG